MSAYLKKILKRSVKGKISFNQELKEHTTFKIGGRPRLWIEPDSLEDLRQSLIILSKKSLKCFLLGGGSNILASNGRIDRAVIKLSAPYFKKVEFGDSFVICGSGRSLSNLVKGCIEKGLSGLEGLVGIPGTVGGAIMMNAGGSGGNIGPLIEWVKVIDYKGKRMSLLKKDRLKFGYRSSNLSSYIILEARFTLKKSSPKILRRLFNSYSKEKRAGQEYRYPNAGCIFKNPKNSALTSGQILELCGLKGLRINDAEVSTRHANFIINRGRARFKDVISLIRREQELVKKRLGILLEPEIRIIR